MNCGHCKSIIDEDSIYCDQCGKEIFICPKCFNTGKSKFCVIDGVQLVSPKTLNKTAELSDKTKNTCINISESNKGITSGINGVVENQIAHPNNSNNDIPVLRLINKNLELDLKIENNDIIGRSNGRFAEIFNKYQSVSGKHLKILYNIKNGWSVTDLNSTNGTMINSIKIKPMQEQILSDKNFLQIANIEFYVNILSQEKDDLKTIRI